MPLPPRPKKGIDKTTLIICCIIGVAALIGCMLLGGAMDCSIDKTGHINITRLGKGFNYIVSHPAYIFKHLADTNSYIPKMLFLGAAAIGIFALYKYSEDKKRLHRRGTEHGSAMWGDAKEMRSLADPAKRKLYPIKVFDRYKFQIKWSKPESWTFENGLLILLNKNGDQTLSFSIEQPEKVDICVNSEPEKPKSAEELQEEISVGTKLAVRTQLKKESIVQHCVIDESSFAEDGTQSIHAESSESHRIYDRKGRFMGFLIDNNVILTKELVLSLNPHLHRLNHNVLVIGGSGAGKTRFYALPNILQLNSSYVVTDPKGEILMKCGEMLRAAGYKVRVFNTIEMEHSNNYNPFHYVYDDFGQVDEVKVKKMVNVLFESTKGDGEKEDMWAQKGRTVIEAIVFLLFEEAEYHAKRDKNGRIIPETRDESHLNFFEVNEKMRKLQYPPRGSQVPDGFFLTPNEGESEADFEARRSQAFLCPLDKDFLELQKRKPDSMALMLYKEIRNAPEETGQGFLSNATTKTSAFNMRDIRNLTCCDNIHLETMGDEKTALFIIISATDRTFNFLAAMLFTQLFDTLTNRANFLYHGQLPVHVRCIIDEFANIGQIPDFDLKIAFVRSMGMSLNVILQAQSQLKTRYEKSWETIIGCCDTFLFLGGQEESTLKSLSEKLGKETIDVKGQNRTKGRQSSTSENNSILGRELLQTNELNTMSIGDCIVMMRAHHPFYCTKYPLEKHPNYKFLGDEHGILPLFDISRIHCVKLEEFQAEQKAKRQNADTSVNSAEPTAAAAKTEPEKTSGKEPEKVLTFFKQSDIQVSAEQMLPSSYEEAAEEMQYAEAVLIRDEVQYNQSNPEFAIPEEWASEDFGEPIIRKERDDSDEEAEISPEPVTEPTDIRHYDIPDAELTVEPELVPEIAAAAVPVITEHSPHFPSEKELSQDADYFDSLDTDIDIFMS